MTTDGSGAAGTPVWVWWALGAGGLIVLISAFVIASRSSDDGSTGALPTTSSTVAETTTTVEETTTTETTTTAPPETTTTAPAETTTTAPAETTTTAPAETTTTAPPPAGEVPSTSVSAVLGDNPQNIYGDGANIFPPGSVEAAWYQWNGFYVVLYRGFRLADVGPVCPGNSQLVGQDFSTISNSPAPLGADAACDGSPYVIDPPQGAQECGDLLYYTTIIPVDAATEGVVLFGSMERSAGGGAFDGQTSQALANPGGTPEFQPGLTAYSLPASSVDDAQVVTCG